MFSFETLKALKNLILDRWERWNYGEVNVKTDEDRTLNSIFLLEKRDRVSESSVVFCTEEASIIMSSSCNTFKNKLNKL